MLRLNVGCGASPTPGWVNLDNSLSVRIGGLRSSAVREAAWRAMGERSKYARLAHEHGIGYADVARRLPYADGTVAVVYSSHMLEHLPRETAAAFLAEALRVLEDGGIVRIVVPDLAEIVQTYQRDQDADHFVDSLKMAYPRAATIGDRLRQTVVGFRGHRWMYDARSLTTLLTGAGFKDTTVLPPGETMIEDPGALDLREREGGSLYVEARKRT